MKNDLIGAIEVSSRAVKLVVGYLLEGNVVVVKSLSTPLDEGAVKEGSIADFNAVNKAINIVLKDATETLPRPISTYAMIIPPVGFEVYHHKDGTSVASPDGKISKIDIEYLYSKHRKVQTRTNSTTVDILPDCFILENNRSYSEPPIDQISNSLVMEAKLHVCPLYLVKSYKKAFSQANILESKMIVAPYAAYEIMKLEKNLPSDFLIIDLGAKITSVSLIGHNQLVDSTFLYRGVDDIGIRLADNFGIDVASAQQLKEMFGFMEEHYPFHPPLFSVINKERHERFNVNYDDWQEEIGSVIRDYAQEINESIHELAAHNDQSIVQFPVILVGGGTKFKGLDRVIKETLKCHDLRIFTPRVLGARDPQFTNCLGAIKIVGNLKALDEEQEKTDDLENANETKQRRIKSSRIPTDNY